MAETQRLEAAAAHIRRFVAERPRIGLVLGSGLGDFTRGLHTEADIPFRDIPGFPPVSVAGHAGRLIAADLSGRKILVLQGRVHYYEGHAMADVVFAVRTLCRLGVDVLVLTNAAGGIDPRLSPGDLMVIRDHINLMGDNPLRGPVDPGLGPRFPDMTAVYDGELRSLILDLMQRQGFPGHEGVYAAMSGPAYETPAEIRMLATLGADAVGMSTVPEAMAARHMGVRVAGISCITNLAAGIGAAALSHEEVTETAARIRHRFSALLNSLLGAIPLPDSIRT